MTPRTRREALQAAGVVAFMVVFMLAVVLIAQFFSTRAARAHDNGQWDNADPEIVQWYRAQMMPDLPAVSCCGEADAYWADDVYFKDGHTYARITDDRDDAALNRSHRDRSEPHLIPDYKVKRGSNPTGHNVIFLGGGDQVYCFIFGTGA